MKECGSSSGEAKKNTEAEEKKHSMHGKHGKFLLYLRCNIWILLQFSCVIFL